MMARLVVAALIAATCAYSPAAAAVCAAAAPADLGPGTATWLGACPKGRADGLGVLRARRQTGTQFFYGRMKAGRPATGVVTTAKGDLIPAWRFDRALKPVDDASGDRSSSVATFDTAAAGARAASARLRVAGNRASARFYAQKARDLELQLD